MYHLMGDGGKKGDPFNFSQNKKSLLGKIMCIYVNNIPSQKQIDELNLWRNYSIPNDNPSANDKNLQGEIWALGLRNPWRCSFDFARPSYFICADVGENEYEAVDLIKKGGNYGWQVFVGSESYHPPSAPEGNTSINFINPILPIMGYTYSDFNNNVEPASITGGYVYRSEIEPCMTGRYIYADLYAGAMWTGTETPENSGNYSSRIIPFGCSKESLMPCEKVPGSETPLLQFIFSFGEDNNKDVFLLTGNGVYRVVAPSKCGYSFPKEMVSKGNNVTPASPSSSISRMKNDKFELSFAFLVAAFVLLRVRL